MRIDILDFKKNKVGEINLPSQFEEEFRPDLIHRVVLAIQSHKRKTYSAKDKAGKRASAKLSRRRRDYRGSYGFGISRIPRKIMTRRGTRMNWIGAFAPGTVGGRRAHPPKPEKILWEKINENEKRKAIRSAIAATVLKDVVKKRGHLIPNYYPFVLDDKFELIDKTKKALEVFKKLELDHELMRISRRKQRAGRGKLRSRKYKKKNGFLVVVSKMDKLNKAVCNIPGIDVIDVKNLNAELLAPGGKAGRMTLWTKDAINILEKDNLFN